MEPDPPSRTQLTEDLLNLAIKVHWADMRPDESAKCIELSQQIIDKASDYQSIVQQDQETGWRS